jgi:hypothetical protein
MIEETLLKSNYIGKDGFSWWLGQIAHASSWKDKVGLDDDKNWGFRVKVRIIGYHSFDPGIISDDDLPFAQVMIDPSFGSSQGGIGGTLDLKGGETCFGFFLDGDDAQQPVVVGLLYRSSGVNNLVKQELVEKEGGSRFKPFTGHEGNFVPATQRDSRAPKTTDQKETSPLSTVDKVNIAFDPNVGFTTGTNTVFPQYGDALRGLKSGIPAASTLMVEKIADITLVKPNGCQNNLIGQISQGLQDFMAFTQGLDKYLDVYIDPILNEIVDIGNQIKSTARQIGGIIKLIINNLRGTIFKCITWAFRKLVGLIVPPPQQTIVLEALKKYLDIIFCILEKLPTGIIDFISNLLKDLVDRSIGAPLCAIEQWTAGILSKVMDEIENGLSVIMSGISWLTGGFNTISGILNQASSLASQIFSFLECTGLACQTPSVWASKFGPSEKEADNWQKMVSSVNVFKGVNQTLGGVDAAIRETPLYSAVDSFGRNYGGLISNSIYGPCKDRVSNPKTQADILPLPPGVKNVVCIPPEISIVGDGFGAKAIPIVGNNNSIFSVKVISGGLNYTKATVSIVDNSGYGTGATAKAIIKDGSIESIAVINVGSGYCPGNNSEGIGITTGIGTTAAGIGTTIGIGTTAAGIGTTAGTGTTQTKNLVGVTTVISGCVKDILILAPGYGYLITDTVTDGKNTYTLSVSNSGSIVKVNMTKGRPVCGFTEPPILTINTDTGVAAELIPIMEYYPNYSFGSSSDSFVSGSGIGVTSVIDCV